jgi:chemotaxis protein methyltransferase CheR
VEIDSDIVEILIKNIFNITGVNLSGYRRSTFERRLEIRLTKLGIDCISYLDICKKDPGECHSLLSMVTINVSSFFRDPLVFEVVDNLLFQLMSKKSDLRIWSVGCASGEEPYSLGILIKEMQQRLKIDSCETLIFGTDIDPESITNAKDATYKRNSLKEMKLKYFDKYFTSNGNKFNLRPSVKKLVHFSEEDILSAKSLAPAQSVFGSFDLILCRNLLIYFSPQHQDLIINKLYKSLSAGGYLVLGTSEEIGTEMKAQFKVIDRLNRVYQK